MNYLFLIKNTTKIIRQNLHTFLRKILKCFCGYPSKEWQSVIKHSSPFQHLDYEKNFKINFYLLPLFYIYTAVFFFVQSNIVHHQSIETACTSSIDWKCSSFNLFVLFENKWKSFEVKFSENGGSSRPFAKNCFTDRALRGFLVQIPWVVLLQFEVFQHYWCSQFGYDLYVVILITCLSFGHPRNHKHTLDIEDIVFYSFLTNWGYCGVSTGALFPQRIVNCFTMSEQMFFWLFLFTRSFKYSCTCYTISTKNLHYKLKAFCRNALLNKRQLYNTRLKEN